jgi:predicted enzyme related to lactoylglutathione lyase
MEEVMNERMNRAVWFEIPAADFERAVRFYESVFRTTMIREEDKESAVFAYDQPAMSGSVTRAPHLVPSQSGAVLYLNADPELDAALERVRQAGGRVVLPRTELPTGGAFAHIEDTEGNRVGLHAVS